MVKIKLDPGHGGKDPGANRNGLREKDLTLQIAKMVKNYLETDFEGADVSLTRSEDRFLELTERAEMANKERSDLFVSIHINSAEGSTANGFETFTYNGSSNSGTAAAQNVIHKAIMKFAPYFTDRGQKKANYAVLRQTNMKAVLTENGFIGNPGDAATLKDPAKLDKIALGHAEGIAQFLGLARKKTPAKTATNLFKVQVGAFAEEKNAIQLSNELIKKGYKPFIVEE
jgi:N-acetylmuramoyl-L-alanine amidase